MAQEGENITWFSIDSKIRQIVAEALSPIVTHIEE